MQYRFCPQCGAPLEVMPLSGRERHACIQPECGFVHWNNPLPVLAAVVEYEDKLLLARNAAWPEKMFALVTGFLERDETPELGVARELKEETNLETEAVSLIGVYEFMRKNELIIAYHVKPTAILRCPRNWPNTSWWRRRTCASGRPVPASRWPTGCSRVAIRCAFSTARPAKTSPIRAGQVTSAS